MKSPKAILDESQDDDVLLQQQYSQKMRPTRMKYCF